MFSHQSDEAVSVITVGARTERSGGAYYDDGALSDYPLHWVQTASSRLDMIAKGAYGGRTLGSINPSVLRVENTGIVYPLSAEASILALGAVMLDQIPEAAPQTAGA